MGVPSWIRRVLLAENDALAGLRERIVSRLMLVCALLALALGMFHLAAGRLPEMLVSVALTALLVPNLVANWVGRPQVLPVVVVAASLIALIGLSIALQGIHGVLWAFPALFIFYFILPRRQALTLTLLLVVVAASTAGRFVGAEIGWRAAATLLLMLLMINVVLEVIGDLQTALVEQAITDPLTGAFNRRHLQTQLAVLARQDVVGGHSLMVIDIDHFKQINDRFGHDIGDQVLKDLVTTATAGRRRGDMLFRTGGEEFVLLLPGTGVGDARRLAEDLCRRVEQQVRVAEFRISVSIGVSGSARGVPVEAWLKSADDAMYEAKRAGRNQVVVAR